MTLPKEFQYAARKMYVAISLHQKHNKKLKLVLFLTLYNPDADLPNTAALLGALVAQETIRMITHQYIPINGFCVIDLVEGWTLL